MADTFVECLVARQKSPSSNAVKFALIFFAAGCLLLGMMNVLFFIPFLATVIASFIIIPRQNLEYEYTFITDQLNIDKIINMSKRKKMGEFEMSRVEFIGPENSREIEGLRSNPANKAIVCDYTSNTAEGLVYGMIYNGEKGRQLILFEPSKKLANALRYNSPSKVKLGEFPAEEPTGL